MEVTAKYDWKGNLSGYRWGDMHVPIAEGNRHYQLIKEAIDNGTCLVNEPAIEEVTETYNEKGNLSGYRLGSIFVPIDENNRLYQMVKKAIDNDTCRVNQFPPEDETLPKSIIFCIFFDLPWHNIHDLFEGKIPYRSNNSPISRDYSFRLINLPFNEDINKFSLLFEYYKIKKEILPIHSPLKFGILELEVPSGWLQKLLRTEEKLLDKNRQDFIEDIRSQHLKESGRSEANIQWAINNAKLYLENFIMEVGNRIIEAYTREFGELPIGYIDRWKVYEETIVINKYKDRSFGIGTFGLQGKPSFNLSGEWQQSMTLLQLSQPEEYPTPPQNNALRRVRMLLKSGWHMEALCLLNAFLEVNLRDVLINCIYRPEFEIDLELILKLDYNKLLKILEKISKRGEDIFLCNEDYLTEIKAAQEILDIRNAYMHRLSMTKKTRKRPNKINDDKDDESYKSQLKSIAKEQFFLSVKERQYLERLMHGFIDVWESDLWLGIQQRLARSEDAAAIEIIQDCLRPFKGGKAGKALRQTLETYGISQNKLAITLGVDRSVVFHWFHENRDPSAQTVVEIAEALKSINPDAAAEFIRLYVGDFLQPDMPPKTEE